MENNDKLEKILRQELTPEEELDRAWGILSKLSREDLFTLMLYLTRQAGKLTSTKLFTKFAHHFKDVRF